MSDSQPSLDAIRLTRRLAVQMAAGTAHEFNNMLAALVGLSDLLRTDPRLPAELLEDAERIHTATLNATKRVRHIQKIAGRTRPEEALEPVDPDSLLRAIQAERSTESHPIEIHDKSVVAPLGDPAEVREILVHLIDNAVEATPEGGRIRITVRDEAGRSIWTLSDDGPGIPDSIRDRIFEPFFTTHAERRGRGLGLAVALGLAESMGAALELTPTVGGTAFELSLPLSAEPSVPVVDAQAAQAVDGPARILIVDDDPTVRDVLLRMVRMDHHEAVAVDSGPAALAELDKGTFDVVVTDLGMPQMDGAQLSAEVHRRCPDAIIVLATGWSPDQDEMRERFEHVALTVSKPVEYEDFAATIDRALAMRRERTSV